MEKVKIFQIYFNDKTKEYLDPAFIPVFNPQPEKPLREILFENAVLEMVYAENHDADILGVTSWKVTSIIRHDGSTLIEKIQAHSDKDVVLYCPKIEPAYRLSNIFARWKNEKSPLYDMLRLIDRLGLLPVDLENSDWVFNFRNYWTAKKTVFDDFVKNWIIPLNDEFRKREKQFNYQIDYRGSKYPAHPFLLETLIGAYLANNKHVTFVQI